MSKNKKSKQPQLITNPPSPSFPGTAIAAFDSTKLESRIPKSRTDHKVRKALDLHVAKDNLETLTEGIDFLKSRLPPEMSLELSVLDAMSNALPVINSKITAGAKTLAPMSCLKYTAQREITAQKRKEQDGQSLVAQPINKKSKSEEKPAVLMAIESIAAQPDCGTTGAVSRVRMPNDNDTMLSNMRSVAHGKRPKNGREFTPQEVVDILSQVKPEPGRYGGGGRSRVIDDWMAKGYLQVSKRTVFGLLTRCENPHYSIPPRWNNTGRPPIATHEELEAHLKQLSSDVGKTASMKDIRQTLQVIQEQKLVDKGLVPLGVLVSEGSVRNYKSMAAAHDETIISTKKGVGPQRAVIVDCPHPSPPFQSYNTH